MSSFIVYHERSAGGMEGILDKWEFQDQKSLINHLKTYISENLYEVFCYGCKFMTNQNVNLIRNTTIQIGNLIILDTNASGNFLDAKIREKIDSSDDWENTTPQDLAMILFFVDDWTLIQKEDGNVWELTLKDSDNLVEEEEIFRDLEIPSPKFLIIRFNFPN